MIWSEIISKADAYLSKKGVPDARVASELLAARLLNVGRGLLSGIMMNEVPERCVDAMRRGMARLVVGEPIQYVIGEWDFRHLTLKCDRRALIPRPETEELVSRVLKHLKSRANSDTSPVIVDVGTGTGAIILSLAQEYRGDAIFIGTDISVDALSLAKENAELCKLASRVRLIEMDGLDDFDEPQCIDVIVSNPPYIESAVCDTLDARVKDYEPRLALDGGASGLEFYDRYLADAINLLRPGGAVFFEIGDGQGASIEKLMFDYGFDGILIEKDYAGHDRYASAFLKQ